MNQEVTISSQILTCPHITAQHRGTMRISHMVEGQHKAQGMDIILNRDISSHQGSSSSIKGVKAGMTIRVRGGPNHLKNVAVHGGQQEATTLP